VSAALDKRQGWLAAAAEEALWHFPPAEAHRQVRTLLERRDFVLKQPLLAGRLLDRAVQSGAPGFETAIEGLVPLRFRIWSPSVVRLARKAQAHRKR
jgi:hypothetical protein